jgi:hypothetical protein
LSGGRRFGGGLYDAPNQKQLRVTHLSTKEKSFTTIIDANHKNYPTKNHLISSVNKKSTSSKQGYMQ